MATRSSGRCADVRPEGTSRRAHTSARTIPTAIGSDSNVRIDPFEELRELEGIARRQAEACGVFTTDELLRFGVEMGARSLGLEAWPAIEVDLEHRSLTESLPATSATPSSPDAARTSCSLLADDRFAPTAAQRRIQSC